MNRETGRQLAGWPHVVQSLQVLFSTFFHERVMRRWFGSLVPHVLGETMSPETLLRFFYSVVVAIELWEPRFRVVQITVLDANSNGVISLRIAGEYFPNATIGDVTTSVNKSLLIIARESKLVVGPFDGIL